MTCAERIASFAEFADGWCYGEGVAFDPKVIEKAAVLAEGAKEIGYPKFWAFPGCSGEIIVTVYQLPDCYEFDCSVEEGITFYHDRDNEEISYEELAGVEQAIERLKSLYGVKT